MIKKSSRNKELYYKVLSIINNYDELDVIHESYEDPYEYFSNLDMFEFPRENALIEMNDNSTISFYGYTNAICRDCQVVTYKVPSEIITELEKLLDSEYEDWELLKL